MESKAIINLGLVAHVDAGKTTVTEQLLYRGGVLRQAGSVDGGTAQTDFLPVERQRGISVMASSAMLEVDGVQLNIIDTPGHVDFSGEVERVLSILDCAILIVSAVEGVQAQTEVLFEALQRAGIPFIVLVNKIDRAGSDTSGVVQRLAQQYECRLLPMQRVTAEGENACGIQPLPLDDSAFQEQALDLVQGEDELLERYLEQGALSAQDMLHALARQFTGGHVIPVLYCCAAKGIGIDELLHFIPAYYKQHGRNRDDDQLSAVVYKISHDNTMGKLTHVRLFGGCLHNRDSLESPSENKIEKISQIRRCLGARTVDIGQVSRGDIAALCGLSSFHIGDVLGADPGIDAAQIATPLLTVQALPEQPDQLQALLHALQELSEEDPLLDLEFAPEERELHIKIMGSIQLEILQALLAQRYGLSASFSPPTVIYKETPASTAEGFESYTMPKPCWAVIRLLIEPGPRGSGLVYRSQTPPKEIPYRYQHHIETTVLRALKQGMYNWEVTDLRVTLIGGGYHHVHTHPMDFFLATPMAVMDGLRNAGTLLLEPMLALRISAQEELVSRVIGDILAMRGSFDTPVMHDGSFTLEARVPLATCMDYSVRLASMSGGRAQMFTRFCGYEECPLELGKVAKRRGVNPLDRSKWILQQRNALA